MRFYRHKLNNVMVALADDHTVALGGEWVELAPDAPAEADETPAEGAETGEGTEAPAEGDESVKAPARGAKTAK